MADCPNYDKLKGNMVDYYHPPLPLVERGIYLHFDDAWAVIGAAGSRLACQSCAQGTILG